MDAGVVQGDAVESLSSKKRRRGARSNSSPADKTAEREESAGKRRRERADGAEKGAGRNEVGGEERAEGNGGKSMACRNGYGVSEGEQSPLEHEGMPKLGARMQSHRHKDLRPATEQALNLRTTKGRGKGRGRNGGSEGEAEEEHGRRGSREAEEDGRGSAKADEKDGRRVTSVGAGGGKEAEESNKVKADKAQEDKAKNDNGKGDKDKGDKDKGVKGKDAKSKAAKKHIPIYGNYHRYYGYRIGEHVSADPRMKAFRKEWFSQKECLDIGCNEGLLTIHIAKEFGSKKMLGIDIDRDLIFEARKRLRQVSRTELMQCPQAAAGGEEQMKTEQGFRNGGALQSKTTLVGDDKSKAEEGIRDGGALQSQITPIDESKADRGIIGNGGALQTQTAKADVAVRGNADRNTTSVNATRGVTGGAEESREPTSDDAAHLKDGTGAAVGIQGVSCSDDEALEPLLQRVHFMFGNILAARIEEASFHTITCLSVTKWIHLNWGDRGLIDLFRKCYSTLRKGGILILEPQPWKSYSNNRQISEAAQRNFLEIKIHPDEFREVLLDKIGFERCEVIATSLDPAKGFGRPLLLFYK